MRAVAKAIVPMVALVMAVGLTACDGSRLARSGDGPTEESTQAPAEAPAGDTAEAPADPPARTPDAAPAEDAAEEPAEAPAAVPTDGLSEEQISEIETALIDAEALLASIEAELAADD